MILRFDPDLEPTGLSAEDELRQAGKELNTSNPDVFYLARDLYVKGEFGEIIMVADGRSYIAEPSGELLEFPDFDQILEALGYKLVCPGVRAW